MAVVDGDMVCPGCGAAVSLQDKTCEYCGRALTFTSLNFNTVRRTTYRDSEKFLKAYRGALEHSPDNPEVLASLGYVLLDRGQYQEAATTLKKAAKNGAEDSDVFFNGALAAFKSTKPFKIKLADAQAIIQDIDTAIEINPKPPYFYTKAKMISVLFERRYLKYKERSADVLQQAEAAGLTSNDKQDIDSLLGV